MKIGTEFSTSLTGIDAILNQVREVRQKFFGRAGGAIRKTAKRSLRKAAQKPLSELTDGERKKFETAVAEWKAGKLASKPRRPERISEPGRPPLLHMKPQSPLKQGLQYAVTADAMDVVVGPSRTKSILEKLERSRPFMEPALRTIEPSLPKFLQQAVG